MSTIRATTVIVVFTALLSVALLLAAPARAGARGLSRAPAVGLRSSWLSAIATFYGPGFYYHRFACAGLKAPDGTTLPSVYYPSTRGVAHRTLPCGSWLSLRYHHRKVWVRVIDRGPFSGAAFDLTGRTAMDLCHCKRPFTMVLQWRRGRHK